jgi:hypothetical protein
MPRIFSCHFVQIAQLRCEENLASAISHKDKNRNSALRWLAERCAEILCREKWCNISSVPTFSRWGRITS